MPPDPATTARAITTRRGGRLFAAVVLGLVLLPPAAALAAPGSDLIDLRPPLTFAVSGDGNNAGFGVEAGEPVAATATPPCPAISRTAWWRIAGTGQDITLSTGGSGLDTVLAAYFTGGGAPSPGNRVPSGSGYLGCNDDHEFPFKTSQIKFQSLRGRSYHVQVGSQGATAGGPLRLTATAPRPPNDDRANAQVLQTGAPATISNLGASQEEPETLTCGAAPFAATIWFRWTALTVGDAVFSASAAFGDTVLTVYRASDGAIVGCNDDVVAPNGASQLSARVAAGDYLLQIGAKGVDGPTTGQGDITASVGFTPDLDVDNDGVLRSSDCNDSDPSIRPGIVDIPDDGIDQDCSGADTVNLDRDRDGVDRPADCNDANAKIRPGAVDVPGNKIDEDCSGRPAPFPRLASTVFTSFLFEPFRFTKLTIVRAVSGSRVERRCRGGGCPFKRNVIRISKSRGRLSVLGADLKKARLKRGAVLEIRITKRGHIGFMRRITVRGAARDPKLQDLCLPAGKSTPKSC